MAMQSSVAFPPSSWDDLASLEGSFETEEDRHDKTPVAQFSRRHGILVLICFLMVVAGVLGVVAWQRAIDDDQGSNVASGSNSLTQISPSQFLTPSVSPSDNDVPNGSATNVGLSSPTPQPILQGFAPPTVYFPTTSPVPSLEPTISISIQPSLSPTPPNPTLNPTTTSSPQPSLSPTFISPTLYPTTTSSPQPSLSPTSISPTLYPTTTTTFPPSFSPTLPSPTLYPSIGTTPPLSFSPISSTQSLYPSIGTTFPPLFSPTSPNPTLFPSISTTSPPSTFPSRLATSLPTAIATETRICNGLASNCYQRVNDIVYGTVHNAMSTRQDGFIGYNQLYSMEEALNAGFRGLQLDVCNCGFCHGFCAVGSRDAVGVATGIATFLEANVNEVVIIELQVTDSDNSFLWSNWNSMVTVPGFQDLIYSHTTGQDWPTLGELVDANKRLIIFQHDGGDCNVVGVCPPLVLNTFDYMWETSYDLTGVTELEDYSMSCVALRGPVTAAFGLSNHFTRGPFFGLPDEQVASQANTALQVQTRLDACNAMLPSPVNLLSVDFWSIGDTLQVVQAYNAGLSNGTAG